MSCRNCFQITCTCDPLFADIMDLNGYTTEASTEIATPLILTLTSCRFNIGIKKERVMDGKGKGKIDGGVRIDLRRIERNFVPTTIFSSCKHFVRKKKDIKIAKDTKKVKKNKTMFNQISLKGVFLEDNKTEQSKINIKVFKNGSIGVSGLKNPVSLNKICFYVLDLLLKIPGSIEKDIGEEDKPIKIWDPVTDMINTTFKIKGMTKNDKIRQKELYSVLSEYIGVGADKPVSDIICRTDKGSTTNIKFKGYGVNTDEDECIVTKKSLKKSKNAVTIFVFGTGSMGIIGTNKPQSIKDAYDFICEILNKHPSIFLKPKIRNLN